MNRNTDTEEKLMRKAWKRFAMIALTGVLMAGTSMVSLAGQWKNDAIGWWWQEDDGSYPANSWTWLDGNRDGIAESYYFNESGYLVCNATVDGYAVNADGAWVENGIVQTQQVETLVQAQTQTTLDQIKAVNSRIPASTSTGSMQTSQKENLEYVLHTPKDLPENAPLVVYLHGHNMGDDIDKLKNDKWSQSLIYGSKNQTPSYVLALLIPPKYDNGKMGMWPVLEPSVMELIDYIATEYKVDRNRISLMGVSMGADGAIQIINDNPEYFSCFVGIVPHHEKCPIAGWESEWTEGVKNTPTWTFVEDLKIAKTRGQAMYDDIIAAGGQMWMEILEGTDHGRANNQVYKEHMGEIYNWLVSTSR